MAVNAARATAALLAAVLALGACGSGSGSGSGSASGSQSGDQPATTESGGGDASSDLAIGGSDAASQVDREVSETLSELDAETRDGNTVVTLPERVLFAFGEHELLLEAGQVLDDLAGVIDQIEGAPVQVNGHTDSVGSTAANQHLSDRRARSVTDHLVAAGVEAGRIHPRGFGEAQPIAPNAHPDRSDDPEGRARNRRVEVVIEGVDLSGGSGGSG
jgi:outer membrane protein OmpA-like peptidoglycan-associated protein